jgi:hypothetical protein
MLYFGRAISADDISTGIDTVGVGVIGAREIDGRKCPIVIPEPVVEAVGIGVVPHDQTGVVNIIGIRIQSPGIIDGRVATAVVEESVIVTG